MFLLEFQDLGLFRHSIVKIQGAEVLGVNFYLWSHHFGKVLHFSIERFTDLLLVPIAVTFMRGLILLLAWEVTGSYFMHRIYSEVLFLLLSHLILDP